MPAPGQHLHLRQRQRRQNRRAALQGLGGAVGAQTRYTSGSTPTERKFTGQIEEGELGIYFYQSRFYDPWLGRFLQADTIVPEPGNPQAWEWATGATAVCLYN